MGKTSSPFRHILLTAALLLLTTSLGCVLSSQAECTTDSDCATGERCIRGGGLAVQDGICMSDAADGDQDPDPGSDGDGDHDPGDGDHDPGDGDQDPGDGDAECDQGLTLCGGHCIDITQDLAHCGSCNFVCQTDMDNAQATCSDSICSVEVFCDDSATPFGGGDGSTDNPWRICSSTHFLALAGELSYLSDHFELFADLSLGAAGSTAFVGSATTPFEGTFDGREHTISHFSFTHDDTAGLFVAIGTDGVVQNLTLSQVDGYAESPRVGALAGENYGLIENVHASGILDTVSTAVGGLVGYNFGVIRNSHTHMSVSGSDQVGGLVGRNSGEIFDSSALHSVFAWDVAGGLVGYNDGTIEDSTASVSLHSITQAGGLAGRNSGVIATSWAESDLLSEYQSGGLVGYNDGYITQSFAGGTIEGEHVLGGLVGANFGTIDKTYAYAHITAGHTPGGLVGALSDGAIYHSYGAGLTEGSSPHGLVGYNDLSATAVQFSFWDADTTSTLLNAAGGTALTTSDFSNANTFNAWDFDEIWQLGLAPDGETRPIFRWQ